MAFNSSLMKNKEQSKKESEQFNEQLKKDFELDIAEHNRMLDVVKKQIIKESNLENKKKDDSNDLIGLVDLYAYISEMKPKKRFLIKTNGQL